MAIKRFISEFRPRFSDFDMQGILNSAQYLDLITEARTDQMIKDYKMTMLTYSDRGQTWVLSKFSIDYKKPIFYTEIILVETEVKEVDGSKALVDFAILSKKSGKIKASGVVTYNLVDLVSKRPVNIPDGDIEIFLSSTD